MARVHNSINVFLLALVSAVSIGFLSACENTAQGLKEDAAAAEVRTRDERAKAAETVRELGSEAARAAGKVAAVAAEAGESLAERAGGVKEAVDVKTALMADPKVDATRIDVDADQTSRTLTLKGYASTAGERSAAEAIARKQAPGYKIVNQITIQARS